MKVQKIMTEACACVRPTTTLNDAACLMWEHDCGSLPVVDDSRRVVGMVTDRDICMAAYHQGKNLKELRAEDAMARDVLSCGPEDEVSDAQRVMSEAQIRRMPVVDGEGRLRGILCLAQIARASANGGSRAISTGGVGETLAAICEPGAGKSAALRA